MKTYTKTLLAAAIILTASQTVPAEAGMNLNLNIGVPAAAAVTPPPSAVPIPPRVVREAAPGFIFSPALGVYFSMEGPSEVFFNNGNYYRYDHGRWYSSPRINGPWATAKLRHLPPGLSKHRYERVRYFRDKDYREYKIAHERDMKNNRHDNRDNIRHEDLNRQQFPDKRGVR